MRVIDFVGFGADEARAAAPAAYEQLLQLVKPERDSNRRASRRQRWWLFSEVMPQMRNMINGLKDYIVTAEAGTFSAAFDITTGKRTDLGELQIALTQNPLIVRRGFDHFDWSVKIAMVAGGLIETKDPYKYLAPESGYQSSVAFAQAKDDPKWQDRLRFYYYVRTAKGQYGVVLIDLTPGSNRPDAGLGIGLSIETWLNPAGSRNLEFDPAKQIRP